MTTKYFLCLRLLMFVSKTLSFVTKSVLSMSNKHTLFSFIETFYKKNKLLKFETVIVFQNVLKHLLGMILNPAVHKNCSFALL